MDAAIIFALLMVVGTLFLGLSDTGKKHLLNQGADEQVVLSLSFIGVGVLLALPLFFTGIPELKEGFWPAVIGTIVLNLAIQNLFIRAFKMSDVSLIVPITLTTPVLVIGTGYLFLGETPSAAGVVGIVTSVLGLYLLLAPGLKPGKGLSRGVVYGLIAVLLSSISFPLDKIAVTTSSTFFAISLIFFSIGFLTALANAVRNPAFLGRSLVALKSAPLSFVGIMLASAAGLFLTNHAFNYALAAYVSSLKRLHAFWTVILAGTFLKERDTGRRLIATLILFVGVVVTAFFS